MSDRELLIRCDCGGDVMAIDLWLKPGSDPLLRDEPFTTPAKTTLEDFENGYLTFYEGVSSRTVRARLRIAWDLFRGRDAAVNCVILNPRDVGRLRDFLNGLDSAPGVVDAPPSEQTQPL